MLTLIAAPPILAIMLLAIPADLIMESHLTGALCVGAHLVPLKHLSFASALLLRYTEKRSICQTKDASTPLHPRCVRVPLE